VNLQLSAALTDNVRTRPLIDGAIRPQSVDLYTSVLYPTEIFWRQLHHAEFDISEMSLSSLMIATSRGLTDWVGLPVFTTRRFFHTGIMVRTDRGIEKPADLAGKRVGVPEFQQTAALWTRGVLRDEFGVEPASMEWFMERNPEQSHGGATGFTPPPGVRLSYVPRDKSIGTMLVDGELDALIHFTPGQNIIDRTTVNPLTSPNVRRLFPSPGAEAHRYYAKTGIYPINHCVVVRRSIAEQHPWVVLNVFNAFVEANERVRAELAARLEPYLATGTVDSAAGNALRAELLPYGVAGSRPVLETVSRYLFDDGLTSRRMPLEEIFSKQTLEL
jgi:4,5-dihydroxyphthalate decarboxylase